ncbi:MAG: hypothetical protein FWF80_05105 [Defluviitaleaceae bacterium]|nr:hypothetical protein [Defluviitaleaceae bacterium]
MAFPLTHLCIAWHAKEIVSDVAQFLLGSIAPDAVHYRAEFTGAGQSNIGATKKITHLCPISDERWGQVTDNDGWVKCIKNFLSENPKSDFAAGYAAHCLADLWNNKTIWNDFRTRHPKEAAKGYASDYYNDLRNIDAQLYFENKDVEKIMQTLKAASPDEIPGIIFAKEVDAIKNNILYEHFADVVFDANYNYQFVTYEDTLNYIQSAAEFVRQNL